MCHSTESDAPPAGAVMLRLVFGAALSLAVLLTLILLASAARAADWSGLVERLVKDGHDRNYVESVFARESLDYDPGYMTRKMNSLIRIKTAPPSTGDDGDAPQFYDRYLSPFHLAGAYAYMREHRELLGRIRQDYGVPPEIMTALLLVETKLGQTLGDHRALEVLASMARTQRLEMMADMDQRGLSDELRPWAESRTKGKADWAYRELSALLKYSRQAGHDPLTVPASVYGAIGICQFMPTNAVAYGADGDGDGVVDLFVPEDALYSMANFLKIHGWKPGLDREGQSKVIYRYNHSRLYTRTILEVASALRKIDQSFSW